MGLSAQGMQFKYSTSTGASSATTAVGEVKSFSFNPPVYSMIEDIHLGSTMETSVPGLRKKSQMTLEGNYVSTDPGQIALQAGSDSTVLQSIFIMFPDSGKTAKKGDVRVSDFSISGGVNEILKFSAAMEFQTPITSTTYA